MWSDTFVRKLATLHWFPHTACLGYYSLAWDWLSSVILRTEAGCVLKLGYVRIQILAYSSWALVGLGLFVIDGIEFLSALVKLRKKVNIKKAEQENSVSVNVAA